MIKGFRTSRIDELVKAVESCELLRVDYTIYKEKEEIPAPKSFPNAKPIYKTRWHLKIGGVGHFNLYSLNPRDRVGCLL